MRNEPIVTSRQLNKGRTMDMNKLVNVTHCPFFLFVNLHLQNARTSRQDDRTTGVHHCTRPLARDKEQEPTHIICEVGRENHLEINCCLRL